MPSSRWALNPDLELSELLAFHQDSVASFRLLFSPISPAFEARFAGSSLTEVNEQLDGRLYETGLRSSFILLTSLEALFKIDFDSRCRRRLKDDLSKYFREIQKLSARPERIRLDDILEGWRRYSSADRLFINQLRGAFKLRDWMAHGRYWVPRHSGEYDFDFVYTMASGIVSGFPFES